MSVRIVPVALTPEEERLLDWCCAYLQLTSRSETQRSVLLRFASLAEAPEEMREAAQQSRKNHRRRRAGRVPVFVGDKLVRL